MFIDAFCRASDEGNILNALIADFQLSTKDMIICNVVLSCSGIYARSRFSPECLQKLQSSPSR